MSEESKTPRTDALEFDRDEDCSIEDNMVVASADCRQLETELAEAKRELEELREDIFWATSAEPCLQHNTTEGQKIAQMAWNMFAAASSLSEWKAVAESLAEALRKLISRDERNTCQHEDTHRGGFSWEICDMCGAKWNDDDGGKPEWKDPPEWVESRNALADFEKMKEGE